jgi:2-isopropylmalate synthase
LKAKLTYEIMKPESVGIPKSSLVLGKHSGRHAFRERIEEMGYSLNDKQLNAAFKRFKTLSDMKKYVYDEDIEMIVMDESSKIPEKYKLLYLNVTCGTATVPTATVKLEVDGVTYQDVATGDGPVDASYKAIKRLSKTGSKLMRFSVNSITKDMDAQGEVLVKLEEKNRSVIGKGADTDIVVASAKAFVNALNRLEFVKMEKGEGL